MPAVVCSVTLVGRMTCVSGRCMPRHILPVSGNFGSMFLVCGMSLVPLLGRVVHLMVLMILLVLRGMILHSMMFMFVHDYLYSYFQ